MGPKNPDLPAIVYYGLFRDEGEKAGAAQTHRKVLADLESKVFQHWDGLATSPSKTRQRIVPDMRVEGLQLVSCTSTGPVWPDGLDAKFPVGTPEQKELQQIKDKFLEEFPAVETPVSESKQAPPRVSGQPDFTVDGGREPLDITREVDLVIEAPPSPADRFLTFIVLTVFIF